MRSILQRITELVYAVAGATIVLLQARPLNSTLIGRDSGVFLYTAVQFLHGGTPYLNSWDHKPPLIYFIDALGISLGSGSRWGVWCLEFIAVFAAGWIGYKLVQRIFGSLSAILASYLFFVSMALLLDGGNLTTEFAVPLQFGCLWLAVDFEKLKKEKLIGLLIGILLAASFLLKQSTIGIGCSILLYLFLSLRSRSSLRTTGRVIALISAGAALFFLPIVFFFLIRGGLSDLWNAAFVYNITYTAEGQVDLTWNQFVNSILLKTGFFSLSLLGWGWALVLLLKNKVVFPVGVKEIVIIGLIDLPLEFFFIFVPGRGYNHYFLTLLPVLCIFSGFAVWQILSFFSTITYSRKIAAVTIGLFILTTTIVQTPSVLESLDYWTKTPEKIRDILWFVEKNSIQEDQVLFWGAETRLNYISERRSPTRFSYQIPLYKPTYVTEKMILECLDGILLIKPKYIIDTHFATTPYLQFPITSVKIDRKIADIQSIYQAKLTEPTWTVYEHIETIR
jgi:hypothetical protein